MSGPERFMRWLAALDDSFEKSVARILLTSFVIVAAAWASMSLLPTVLSLPWWVTVPPLAYGFARFVWWTIR